MQGDYSLGLYIEFINARKSLPTPPQPTTKDSDLMGDTRFQIYKK